MKKYIFVILVCTLLSGLSGLLTNDLLVGGTTLLTGLLCAYFASEGKRSNYIFGLINYLLMGYVALTNHLYGIFFFYLFIFAPLQIRGFLVWNKNLDDGVVVVRDFTLINSLLLIFSCVVGSLLLGYLLSLIPGQRIAFMDASSNCINLCGVILMILRFKESWWLWLINNIIDLAIWIVTVFIYKSNSIMMVFVSIGFLLINIYGIIKWTLEVRRKKNE